MSENELWIGLAVGLVPYRIARRFPTNGGWTLEIRALFWSLYVHRNRSGRHNWLVRIPLIERLRDAAWAAVMRLRGQKPPNA